MSKKAIWRNFTRQEIESYVLESDSYASLGKKLGYNVTTGSYATTIKGMISELGLDTSHFLGQSWHKNKFNYKRFVKGNSIKSPYARNAIVAIRGWKCEICNKTEWLNNPIPLEIHHIDGDSFNNTLENLQLLCPNCHTFTANYGSKNNHFSKKISDDDFTKALMDSKSIREALKILGLSAKGKNYQRAREIIYKYNMTHLMPEHQERKLLE